MPRRIAAALILSVMSLATAAPVPGEKVADESKVRGSLSFKSRRVDFEGTDVGIENEKRKYITGHPDSPQRAIWGFERLSRGLASAPGDTVSARWTCATFAMTKPDEKGVRAVIRAVSHTCPQTPPTLAQKGEWQWVPPAGAADGKTPRDRYLAELAGYRARKIEPEGAKPGTDGWKAANDLAEMYGYFETPLADVLDEQERSLSLPAGLFRNALNTPRELGPNGKPTRPLVSVYVKCDSAGQMLGVSEEGFYLVAPAGR